jgi:ABC-type oligopeptide transport system substrate-binding subunit
MDKIVYNSILWLIIAALLAILLTFIVLFKRSNAITLRTKSELIETRNEYEDYRKRNLVREQQIVRQLYDEILKYKSKLNL